MNTLSRSILSILMCFFILFFVSTKLNAQDLPEYNLEKIVVTAGRTPISFSDLARNVIIISRNEIELMPVNSIQDLLQYSAGIDLKQRGLQGTQADASIRGGSFEQTLILIDGVKISDPQTGHHNLNLPISTDQIERIEILKGQGSRIFGPNAFSGAINFITKKTRENIVGASISGGSYSSFDMNINGAYSTGLLTNHISFSHKKSDGHLHNTNFDMINGSYSGSVNIGSGVINTYYGFADQKFGANSFYSLKYPNQWENVKTNFASLSGEFGNDTYSLTPKLYWRKKNDEFLLDYTNPSFYKNLHETISYGIELQSTIRSNFGSTSFGGEYSKDEIESTNLGSHVRENKGLFAEHCISPVNNLFISIGAFVYNYATIGWKLWPGFDASYRFSDYFKIKSSIGKAFRIPSYTDLYYNDPVTLGNSNLKSEETLNYEFSFTYSQNLFMLETILFRKEGKNIIDWVRANSEDKWTAQNITEINTTGFEVALNIFTSKIFSSSLIEKIDVNYTYLNSDKSSSSYESRYILDYLRHQLIVGINTNLGFGIKSMWNLRYEDRVFFEKQFLVDATISRNFENGQVFIKAMNIFDRNYHDIGGILLPGRWITIGAKINFSDL